MKVQYQIHESHLPLWERDDWRYAILMGGRGNGRSGTASRYSVSQLLSKEYTRGAIMRATREDIRASCWGDIQDRLIEQEVSAAFRITENDMFIQRGQNSLRAHGFRSSSGSLTARLKSLAGYNYIWIEEGEEIGEEEFRKLDDTLRTVKGRIRIIITLNTPPKHHWIIRKWFNLAPSEEADGFYIPSLKPEVKDVLYLGGTWRENSVNIDPHTIERYENYAITNPAYYWQVIQGLSPESVRGRIYSGWQQIESVPKEARLIRFGEDYGWFPDPACAVAIYYWNGAYIVDELAYGTELTNEYLAGEIKKVGTAITVADSAEPKSIAEQNRYKITVIGCEKGADSVAYRTQIVSQKKIYVTKRSKNVWLSYENYAWAEDKDGNPKGEPVHTWSHAMDALGYPIVSLHNQTHEAPGKKIEQKPFESSDPYSTPKQEDKPEDTRPMRKPDSWGPRNKFQQAGFEISTPFDTP